jgi:hypothetical protein
MDESRYQNYSIELDCPPGNPRPSDLIGGVLHDTGIEVSDFDTAPPFFGHQTWVLKAEAGKDELFVQCKPTFKSRIEALYHAGRIRYGTW